MSDINDPEWLAANYSVTEPEPHRAGLPTSETWTAEEPHPAEGCRPSADDTSNVLSALKTAVQWHTSALPDGGEGAEIEARANGVRRTGSWDGDGWVTAQGVKGLPGDLPLYRAVCDWSWRWVTKPAEATERMSDIKTNCWTCEHGSDPRECETPSITVEIARWLRGYRTTDGIPRTATGCPGYSAKPAEAVTVPTDATDEAQVYAAISTGLSREGVARKQRDSWRLGSREELIAKVETERGYVSDYAAQIGEAHVAHQALELRFNESVRAAESLAADLAEMRRERDEARASLAEFDGTDRKGWRDKVKREREAHDYTRRTLTWERDTVIRERDEALAELAGTVEANEYLMGIITTIANESGLPDGEAEDALPEWLRDGRAEVHAFLLNIARGGRLDDEIDLLYTLERGPDALADAARKEGGG